MGTKLKDGTIGKTYKNAIHELGRLLVERFIRIYLYIDFVFKLSALGKKQQKCLAVAHNFTRKVIKYVTQNGIHLFDTIADNDDDEFTTMYAKKRKTAMLDLLILAQQDGLIDSVGVEEEVDTFMFEV